LRAFFPFSFRSFRIVTLLPHDASCVVHHGFLSAGLAIGRFALVNGKMFTRRDCKRARLPVRIAFAVLAY
jgi:hypothetical protein